MERLLLRQGRSSRYSLGLFRRDLIAGLTVAALAVPQAMAYALIAGVPPEYGLYTAIVVTAVGSVFGSSSHLINGPTNAISLVVFSAVAGLNLVPDDPGRLQAVFLLALLVAAIQILIAILKLGDLTRYVSESVVLGFMAGAGVLVALGQVHNLLGLQKQGDGHLHFLHRLWLTLTHGGPINPYATAIGMGAAVTVVVLRRLGRRVGLQIPDMLIGLLLASAVATGLQWVPHGPEDPGLLAVVGQVPRELPRFHLPHVRADWIQQLSGSALAVALLGLLEAMAIAKSIAARTGQALDFNQQCLAEGVSNLAGGFFQCMPGSGSLTRSAINFQAGAATRLSGMLAAAAVAITVLLFAPWAQYVPKSALAGLLMVTAWRLVDRSRLHYCIRASRFDAGIALGTAAAAVFISIEFSILIGVFLSFLFFVPRAARLGVSELVVGQDRVLRDRQPNDPQCTRMALIDLEGELFFGAAPLLEEHLAGLRCRIDDGVRIIVLRVKRARNPDMVCLEILQRFFQEVKKRGATVLLCGVREDFAQALRNVRMHHALPAEHIFHEEATIGSSTLHAVRKAYELLGADRCPTCPRHNEAEEQGGLYYMI